MSLDLRTQLPNFLIVGAAKSGTTSLFYYLNQHPEIFIPKRKECRFFSSITEDLNGPGDKPFSDVSSVMKTLDEYKSLFLGVTNEKAIGEITPDNLYYYKNSIKNIKNVLGSDIRIIIILRNPIERAFSNYLHHIRDGIETLSFEDALQQENERKKKKWWFSYHIASMGFYYKQVKAYLENFSKVKIYLFDDLKKDALTLTKNIYDFLEVDSSFTPDISFTYNVTGIPKNKFIYVFLTKPNLLKSFIKPIVTPFLSKKKRKILMQDLKIKNLEKPKMKPETHEYLKNLYREDISRLEDLINRDLSHWLR